MKTDSAVLAKSKQFALRVIRLYKHLTENKIEFVISKQLLRSGTSIGANVREAVYGQSRKDFISKMSIALKESAETGYWLELLIESGYVAPGKLDDLVVECQEMTKILTSIVKSSKEGI